MHEKRQATKACVGRSCSGALLLVLFGVNFSERLPSLQVNRIFKTAASSWKIHCGKSGAWNRLWGSDDNVFYFFLK